MRFLLPLMLAIVLPHAARADCFDDLGRTGCPDQETFTRSDLRRLSCENLWLVRNSIYNANGYCFRTPDGRAQFDNSDCYVEDAAQVKLNAHERENVARIKAVEQAKGCAP